MDVRCRACAVYILDVKKIEKTNHRNERKKNDKTSMSPRGIEQVILSLQTNFTETSMVCEFLLLEVIVTFLLSYPLTYLLSLSTHRLALLAMAIKLENCTDNLIMLFLKYFQLIQVIPFEPSSLVE